MGALFLKSPVFFSLFLSLLCLGFLGPGFQVALGQVALGKGNPPLSGHVRHNVQQQPPTTPQPFQPFRGHVLDAKTRRPLPHARIDLPSYGIQREANQHGQFSLPFVPDRPFIISIQQKGYQTFTGVLDPKKPLTAQINLFTLQATQPRVIIDTQLRHLGDNLYSATSSGAQHFKKPAEGPIASWQFQLPATTPRPPSIRPVSHFSPSPKHPILTIGAVIGLDTLEAHQRGQSTVNVISSPMRILLNGFLIGQIGRNGANHRLPFPIEILNFQGVNTLQIQSGYHHEPGSIPDFDDLELMHISLTL